MGKLNELVKFEDIWEQAIIDPLKSVKLVNGYENDLLFLNGWLIHYALDISKGKNGWSFPAVGAHSDTEDISTQARGGRHESITSKNNRGFTIEVAIDVVGNGTNVSVSRETLLSRMESSLRDVKKAIATVSTRNVTLTHAKFQLPEDSEDYAFIVISGNITYNETW